jgi:hypothetical protein
MRRALTASAVHVVPAQWPRRNYVFRDENIDGFRVEASY